METDSPTEYLKLFHKSPLSLYPLYNYTKSLSFDNFGIVKESKVKIFEYLKLFTKENRLYISPSQHRFTQVYLNGDSYQLANLNQYFGEAVNLFENGEGSANINLQGTPFKISENIKFELYSNRSKELKSSYVQIEPLYQDINLSISDEVDRVLSFDLIEILPK